MKKKKWQSLKREQRSWCQSTFISESMYLKRNSQKECPPESYETMQ